MSPAKSKPITFIVPGHETRGPVRSQRTAAGSLFGSAYGHVKQSVQVSTQREGSGGVRVAAIPGEDVVVLQIAGGPELVLHPEHARDLMRAQQTTPSRRPRPKPTCTCRRGYGGVVSNRVRQSRGATRGALGDVVLSCRAGR